MKYYRALGVTTFLGTDQKSLEAQAELALFHDEPAVGYGTDGKLSRMHKFDYTSFIVNASALDQLMRELSRVKDSLERLNQQTMGASLDETAK